MPVYIVRRGPEGPVKIGLTSAAAADGRLVKMQVDCAEPLTILRMLEGGRQTEVALHARFKELRLRGEWFRFSEEMMGDFGLPDFNRPPKPPSKRGIPWSAKARVAQLQKYLADRHIAVPVFADTIGVSVQSVHRYLNGERFPTPENLALIAKVTEGAVTANDFAAHHEALRTAAETQASGQPQEAA